MKISREDVLRVAELANLDLTDAEIETYGKQLSSIITYCEKLNELNTDAVEPMAQVLATGVGARGLGEGEEKSENRGPGAGLRQEESEQHLREDVPVQTNVADEVLRGAPDPNPPYFRVPKVIER